MQAGQARKRLTFRDIFTSIHIFWRLVKTVCEFILEANLTDWEDSAISEALNNAPWRWLQLVVV